jgi:hypothetical protein
VENVHVLCSCSISQHVPSLLLKYGPHGSFRNLPEDAVRARQVRARYLRFSDRAQLQFLYPLPHLTRQNYSSLNPLRSTEALRFCFILVTLGTCHCTEGWRVQTRPRTIDFYFIDLRFVHSTVVFLHPKLSFAICLCL